MYRNIEPETGTRRLAQFAVNIVGKSFTIIQTTEVKVGDVLINFQVTNVGYETPTRVKKITKAGKEFYDIEFEGWEGKRLPRFAYSCLFGRLIKDQP